MTIPQAARHTEPMPSLALQHHGEVRAMAGESRSGDAIYVRSEGNSTLFAVIDALGHGPVAADVAQLACACLATVSLERGALYVLTELHARLSGTRGAAAFLGLFDGNSIEHGGVGNVDVRTRGTRLRVYSVPGVLGHRAHNLRTFRDNVSAGDRIVVHSDGLSARFDLAAYADVAREQLCWRLLGDYGRNHDDASVLVVDIVSAAT